MSPQEIVNTLLSLEFVCFDDKAESRKEFHTISPQTIESGLSTMMSWLKFSSIKTGSAYNDYLKKRDYDSFHLCSHFLFVDKLINYVLFDYNCNVKFLINETLRCSTDKNKELIDSLLSLEQKRKMTMPCFTYNRAKEVAYERLFAEEAA